MSRSSVESCEIYEGEKKQKAIGGGTSATWYAARNGVVPVLSDVMLANAKGHVRFG